MRESISSTSRLAWRVLGCWLIALLSIGELQALRINGLDYVSLPTIAERFGMEHDWTTPGVEAVVRSRWSNLSFTLHRRYFDYNGQRVYLGSPIAAHQGALHISEIDYARTLKPLLFPHQFDPKPKLYHIVIDAGHGGKDSGAQNRELKLQEKHLALDLARRIQTKLASYGYKVTLTRERDEYIPLEERAAIANRLNADLFISVHFNAVDSDKVDGIETFVMTPIGHPSTSTNKITSGARRGYAGNQAETWSLLAGYHVQRGMVEQTNGDDRGLKRARFAVLRGLDGPGILIEGGFITHPIEGRNIGSAAYREKIANGVLRGVLEYQKALNRARGFDS